MVQESRPSIPSHGDATTGDRSLVLRLKTSEVFRNYQTAFHAAVGMPLVLQPVGSFRLAFHETRHANPFCMLMAAHNKSCAACLQLQQRLEEESLGDTLTLECYAGLAESAVPIRVGDRLIGFLRTGQVSLQPLSQTGFQDLLRQLGAWQVSLDRDELEQAYFGTRVVARRRHDAVLRLLVIFAQHLSALANQLMIAEEAPESPSIAKARVFLTEHFAEELSLAAVADAVNMSPFYFCKIFKRETGMTFTRFLARVRIEQVKHSLVKRHTRISQAAFEAGFTSLSQFNRVFREIAGESPSDYRLRLNVPDGSSHRRRAHAGVGSHLTFVR